LFPYINVFNSKVNSGIKIFAKVAFQDEVGFFKGNEKLKDLLQNILKMNTEFYSKIRNILCEIFFDYISKLKDSLTNLIYKNGMPKNYLSSDDLIIVDDNEKLDLIFLLIFSKIISSLRENLNNFKEFFMSELQMFLATVSLDEKKRENIKCIYSDELNEIIILINTEMLKILHTIVIKNLNNTLNYSNLDLFLENYYAIFFITKSAIITESFSSNFVNLFNKIQIEFIKNYYSMVEKKMRESVDCENWQSLKNIPINFQKMVNFISKYNYLELRGTNINYEVTVYNIIKIFEENEILLENEKDQIEIKNDSFFIQIYSSLNNLTCSFKMNICSLEVIKTIYNSLKLISLFEKSVSYFIEQNLANYLKNFIFLLKVHILEGEALKKGRVQKLSQTEVSITNANASIIKNLILNYINNNSIYEKEKIYNISNPSNYDELLNELDKIKHTCRYNISNMLNDSIKDSISALSAIDLSNYPTFAPEDKSYNNYVKIYLKFSPVYLAMMNTFEESEIFCTFQENLKIFIDKLEKCLKNLNEKQKITDIDQIKQYILNILLFRFRKDFTTIKKSLNFFKILAKPDYNLIEFFQEKVDSISKSVVPKTGKKIK
jgi:hypothetical protein